MRIPPDFVPNLDLVAVLTRYAGERTPEGKLRMFRALRQARLLVPRRETGITAIQSPKGERFLPAFTRAEELHSRPLPEQEAAVLTLPALHHIVVEHEELTGVVLDPFGKALLLRRPQLAEIESATEGMTVRRTEHSRPPLLSPARDFPVALPDALRAFLATQPAVLRAWLLHAQESAEASPHKLFLLDFDGPRDALFPAVAQLVRPFMRPGESFELVKATYPLLMAVEGRIVPVYIRPPQG